VPGLDPGVRFRCHALEPDAEPKLLLFSGTGFTPELAADAADSGGTVQLIGLERLYSGS
jgi:hypothetical protein